MTLSQLWASAAKHTIDEALRERRRAIAAPDYWTAEYHRQWAKRLSAAGWSHLEAAREARERAAA